MNWGFPNSVAKVKIKLSYEIGMMNYFENVFFAALQQFGCASGGRCRNEMFAFA
jgi:hypothetical protein